MVVTNGCGPPIVRELRADYLGRPPVDTGVAVARFGAERDSNLKPAVSRSSVRIATRWFGVRPVSWSCFARRLPVRTRIRRSDRMV